MQIESIRQGQIGWSYPRPKPVGLLFCLIALLGVGLSAVLFSLPTTIDYDFGARSFGFPGMYPPERNAQFSYAYTNGDASLVFPEIGHSLFVVQVRLGGPDATIPVPAQIHDSNQHFDLATVAPARTYALLLPSDQYGDLNLRVTSGTTTLHPDPRALGVFLDRLDVQSLGTVQPPWSVLVMIPLTLLVLGYIATQLPIDRRWRLLLFGASSGALLLSASLCRGRFPIQPWWLLGSGSIAVLVSIWRFDGRRFAHPIQGIGTLFIIWRLGLWLVGGVGAWYSTMLFGWGKANTFGGAVVDRAGWAWQTFAGGWLYWDAEHYQSIAAVGYSFHDERFPTIAFFPLYPLLIRVTRPLAGGSVTLAALLLAHVAFFAALLLLYNLLQDDFGSVVAYRTIILLLVFPASLFFATAYSESLGLLLVVAVVWALRRERWWLAGTAGAMLALTRLPGVMSSPLLVLIYFRQQRWQWRSLRPGVLAAAMAPVALGLFMLYQWWRFGTPLAFMEAQQAWKNHLSPPWIMPRDLFGAIVSGINWPRKIVQLVIWVGVAILTGVALWRLPLLYGLTALLLLVPPYFGSWSESLGRHALIVFPLFVVLAQLPGGRWARTTMTSILLVLLVMAILLFVNGFWVA